MKVKQLTVSRSVKLSINYNSIQSTISVTAEIDNNENEQQVYNQLSSMVDVMLEKDIQNQMQNLIKFEGKYL